VVVIVVVVAAAVVVVVVVVIEKLTKDFHFRKEGAVESKVIIELKESQLEGLKLQ
jgi:hypothetical protein